MKTTKGGKVMNPTDAYRKELRKKELKRNKKERKKVREVGILKKDPDSLKDQIQKLEMMKADGALDKARKHKKRQLEDTLNLVIKKRKEYEDKMKEKGETPVMFSHLGPLRKRTSTEEEELAKQPNPEDSVYYHPTLNPTGAPPPGKPIMFKSAIGPGNPLSASSSNDIASSSKTDFEDMALLVPPPPPPPPPPMSDSSDMGSSDAPVIASFLPLPPPPPLPPNPAAGNLAISILPPPRVPPKEQVANRPPLPPPPPLQQSILPPPPPLQQSILPPPPQTTGLPEIDSNPPMLSDDHTSKERLQVSAVLPQPPPPPGMAPKSANNLSEGVPSPADHQSTIQDGSHMLPPPPPPPPRQPPPVPGPSMIPTLQPDVLPPGISRHLLPPPPPPPPSDMLPPLPDLPLPNRPGMMPPFIPRLPYGPPLGHMPVMAPPLPPGPPPASIDDDYATMRPPALPKPSYVKSAASTVVKRPLAQHTPELTAMVPASVRVRRETVVTKSKPKLSTSIPVVSSQPVASTIIKSESISSTSVPKPQSIDDSYMAFLEDMKALGALDR